GRHHLDRGHRQRHRQARHLLRPGHHRRHGRRPDPADDPRLRGHPGRHGHHRPDRRRRPGGRREPGLTRAEPTGGGRRTVPLFASLPDVFNAAVLHTLNWADSYGAIEEAGGRARVPCTIDYAAYASATFPTLQGSPVQARMVPPAAGGATEEVWSQILVTTT